MDLTNKLTDANKNKKKIKLYVQKTKRLITSRKLLPDQLRNIKIRYEKISAENKRMKHFKNSMSKIFSNSQVESLMKNNSKKVKWTSEDISRSFVIRSMSAKCYDFWRERKI